jgi:hypothetical protein
MAMTWTLIMATISKRIQAQDPRKQKPRTGNGRSYSQMTGKGTRTGYGRRRIKPISSVIPREEQPFGSSSASWLIVTPDIKSTLAPQEEMTG